jgi:hypothetical protein
MSNLLECSMVISFKSVSMMSAFEIVNSPVGIGKYEVSNSPFFRRGRESTHALMTESRVNM